MKIIIDKGAFPPCRAHKTDAGIDLRAKDDFVVIAGGSKVLDTGIHVELPKNTAGLLVSKSGLNVAHDITSTGLIDEGYTGSIKVKLYNHGKKDYFGKKADKISQLVIIPIRKPKLVTAYELRKTERGNGGFGSTGR